MSEESTKDFRSGMIALVGETNAGKSTLINALLGAKVSIVANKPHTTRNRIVGVKNLPAAQLVVVDTPGFARKNAQGEMGKYASRVLQESARGSDLLLLVIDTEKLAGEVRRVDSLFDAFQKHQLGVPAVVALNKVDLVRKDRLLPIIDRLAFRLREAGQTNVDFIPVSARTGEGLDVLERVICERLPLGPALFPDTKLSDQPEDFLASEIIREKLLAVLMDELPHSVAVRVEDWEDEGDLLTIHALILIEKDSQKGIIIGQRGSRLKEIGQQAREELEKLFGVKVFLKLFVRVESDWTKSEKGLMRAGYLNEI